MWTGGRTGLGGQRGSRRAWTGQPLEAKFQFATGLLLMNSVPPQSEVAHACDSSASRQSPFGTPISLGIITEDCPDCEQRLHTFLCDVQCNTFLGCFAADLPPSLGTRIPRHGGQHTILRSRQASRGAREDLEDVSLTVEQYILRGAESKTACQVKIQSRQCMSHLVQTSFT